MHCRTFLFLVASLASVVSLTSGKSEATADAEAELFRVLKQTTTTTYPTQSTAKHSTQHSTELSTLKLLPALNYDNHATFRTLENNPYLFPYQKYYMNFPYNYNSINNPLFNYFPYATYHNNLYNHEYERALLARHDFQNKLSSYSLSPSSDRSWNFNYGTSLDFTTPFSFNRHNLPTFSRLNLPTFDNHFPGFPNLNYPSNNLNYPFNNHVFSYIQRNALMNALRLRALNFKPSANHAFGHRDLNIHPFPNHAPTVSDLNVFSSSDKYAPLTHLDFHPFVGESFKLNDRNFGPSKKHSNHESYINNGRALDKGPNAQGTS